MATHEDYKESRWRKLRLQAMDRDEWGCVNCGRDIAVTLHVHHKRYRGSIFNSSLDDLQTLCEECHGKLGKHPKGGIWWGSWRDECEDVLYFENCPRCGSTSFKDKGSYSKCRGCSWSPPDNQGLSMVGPARDTPEPQKSFSQVITNLRRLGVEGVGPGERGWLLLARDHIVEELMGMMLETVRSGGLSAEIEAIHLEAAVEFRRLCQRRVVND